MNRSESPLGDQSIENRGISWQIGVWSTVLIVCIGALLVIALKPLPSPTQAELRSKPDVTVKVAPSPEEIATPHLARAEQECERVIEEHLAAVDTFFADAKKNTRPFAEQALSWGSKWRLVADYVPFTSKVRHETFVCDKFQEYVFRIDHVEDTVKHVVANYLKHTDSIEGQMLVDIKTDVADFPSTCKIAKIDPMKLRASYDEAIARAIEATGSSLRADIGTELASIISTVESRVAARK